MQELLDRFRELNFNPPDIQLDGQIHRFDRDGNENAWYIGWKNVGVRNGKTYAVAMFGDWKTGEQHQYKPTKDVSTEDKAAIKIQIDQAMKRAQEQKAERQREASERADKSWSKCDDVFESEYYERKLIAEPLGTKTFLTEAGRVIAVPMRDVEGVLWGLQRIFPDGQKRFIPGQRVLGTFHLIGEIGTEVLLCEGFATGASLRQATGKPVIVAFNAGNLVEVSKQVRKKHPGIALTVCGDDDKWNEPNAGREKATKAAMISQAGVIFPEFADTDGKPTDFNDLHVREGIDAVRRAFMKEAGPDTGFIPLGYEEGVDFYYSIESKDVVKVTGYAETSMLRLAPESYWAETYPSKSGIRWLTAKNDLIQRSKAIGPFDSSRIRGTGVWVDAGRVVVNTGHCLIVDGETMPLSAVKSWHVYVQTKNRMPPIHDKPLTVAEAGALVDVCQAFNWREPARSPFLLAGWLAIARVAAALQVRPHVWLTGGSGTGKSTIMERVVSSALGGPKGKIYLQGGSTEAGIRQEVKSSSLPVIFDEFETNNEQNRERVSNLVELLRQSWSSTQGVVVKGSVSGIAVQYQLSFAALVSSIRINLDNDADRSRFSVLELAPHGSDSARWHRIQTALRPITWEFGERLFARSCAQVRTIIETQKRIVQALSQVMGQRFAQQTGTLLAGYWSLISDDVIDDAAAENLVRELDLTEDKADIALTDEVECLNHLLTWKLTIKDTLGNSVDRTISQIAESNFSDHQAALKTYGIIVEPDGMLIANEHAELQRIFARTRWAADYKRSLRRIPGAVARPAMKFAGKTARATFVPFSAFR